MFSVIDLLLMIKYLYLSVLLTFKSSSYGKFEIFEKVKCILQT